MSLGTWDPQSTATASAISINQPLLLQWAELSRNERLDQLSQLLDATALAELQPMMQLDTDVWESALAELDTADLLHLVRFFTVAENLPECEAGDKSPVIPIARLLRQRGSRLEKQLLQWIRANSSNRFLPYGPL